VTLRSPRVGPTQGLIRDAWQSGPYSARETGCSPFTPVRGVTLELFADIARTVASRDDAHSHGTELAESMGVAPSDWLFACRTWNTRIADNPAVAQHLSALYGAAAPSLAS
jgi:hypothetical protein